MNYESLINDAFKALENAYAPYSNYRVGACVVTKDGRKFYGANIENASFSLTNCAERSAIFNAYSNGVHKDEIEALAIVSESKKLAAPCGACRQVLSELLESDTPIVLSNHLEVKVTNIHELLPMTFTNEDLENDL